MSLQPRTLHFLGLTFVLALLLSVSTMTAHQASAHTSQAANPLLPSTAHFVQRATSSNIVGTLTYIDNIATNNLPDATLFVTSNFNPSGNCGCISDPHPIGVYYDGTHWAIFNEDGYDMPVNAAFNVLVVNRVAVSGQVLSQIAASYNTFGYYTLIDNVFTNGNPSAQLLVTQIWNPDGRSGGTSNAHNIGVWYDAFAKKWAIFNEDRGTISLNAAFNVLVGAGSSGGGTEFLQMATSSNTGGNSTFINNSLTNGAPGAFVFATHNWNPGKLDRHLRL